MTFRYARHTDNLKAISAFYTKVIGLEKLSSFENHADYNGVFFGFPYLNWHLEFTESKDNANHKPDDDDILVFYVNSHLELSAIVKDAHSFGALPITPKNPYWQTKGVLFKDPDNFNVVISVKQIYLHAKDPTTLILAKKGITTWEQCLDYIRLLPYGRNSNRSQLELVLVEGTGTCSSKHALVKQIADLNQLTTVQLILGIYKMNEINTPGIGSHLSENNLSYLPEAHCYLNVHGKRIDLTSPTSNIQQIEVDLLEEHEITPSQVAHYKVDYHRQYLTQWLTDNKLNLSLDELWEIREDCISELTRNNLKDD